MDCDSVMEKDLPEHSGETVRAPRLFGEGRKPCLSLIKPGTLEQAADALLLTIFVLCLSSLRGYTHIQEDRTGQNREGESRPTNELNWVCEILSRRIESLLAP